MEPVIGAVIGALTGSDDPNEVAVMAKQASEVQRSDLSSTHHCIVRFLHQTIKLLIYFLNNQ